MLEAYELRPDLAWRATHRGGPGRLGSVHPGAAWRRFIYLNWGTVDDDGFGLFRRAKLWLDGVPPGVLEDAVRTGVLVGRLGLTDAKGNPTCTAGRPPTIEWSAGPG
jgi:hypothetical protein